jgi:DNA-binding NtrC family response regulator
MMRYSLHSVAYLETAFGALWRADRARAESELKSALYAAKGNVNKAAAILMIGRRQFYRYLHATKLIDELSNAREDEPAWLKHAKELCDG